MFSNSRYKTILMMTCVSVFMAACAETKINPYAPLHPTEMFESNSYYNDGYRYQNGLGVPTNYQMAVENYRMAISKHQDTRAMNELAVMTAKGQGVAADPKAALELLTKAAAAGNSKARFNLGVAYFEGYSVKEDKRRGLELVVASAEQGNVEAQAFMTEWMRSASLDEQNDPKIRNLIRRLSEQGNKKYWELAARGTKYPAMWSDFFNLPLQNRNAMLTDLLALESNCEECASENRRVVARKLNQLEYWKEKAAKGDPASQYNMGVAYLFGDGVPQDKSAAARLLAESADKGYVPAQYTMGLLLHDGVGVKQNKALAYAWFSIAASSGSKTRESSWADDMKYYLENYGSSQDVAQGQAWAKKWYPNVRWYSGY